MVATLLLRHPRQHHNISYVHIGSLSIRTSTTDGKSTFQSYSRKVTGRPVKQTKFEATSRVYAIHSSDRTKPYRAELVCYATRRPYLLSRLSVSYREQEFSAGIFPLVCIVVHAQVNCLQVRGENLQYTTYNTKLTIRPAIPEIKCGQYLAHQ